MDRRRSSAPTTTPPRTAWLVLTAVFLADVMDLIDSSVANLAGPSAPPPNWSSPSRPA